MKGKELKNTLLRILELVEIIPAFTQTFEDACLYGFNDLEDAFQYQTALQDPKIAFFITGNTKDFLPFAIETLPVLSPKEFLKIM